MDSSLILSYTTFVFFGAFMAYLLGMVMNRDFLSRLGTYLSLLGFTAQTLAIILRWDGILRNGHRACAPFQSLRISGLFFLDADASLPHSGMAHQKPNHRNLCDPTGVSGHGLCLLFPNISSQIQPLIPALKSNWLISHVITCFFGYAAFALSFGVSIMYLLKRLDAEQKNNLFLKLIPSTTILDDLNYQMIVIGFLMLTLGIITGSVWAHSAWGTYWSWDPKETWSLITWLVYASVIHTRLVRGWKGKKIAILSIVGVCLCSFYLFRRQLFIGTS